MFALPREIRSVRQTSTRFRRRIPRIPLGTCAGVVGSGARRPAQLGPHPGGLTGGSGPARSGGAWDCRRFRPGPRVGAGARGAARTCRGRRSGRYAAQAVRKATRRDSGGWAADRDGFRAAEHAARDHAAPDHPGAPGDGATGAAGRPGRRRGEVPGDAAAAALPRAPARPATVAGRAGSGFGWGVRRTCRCAPPGRSSRRLFGAGPPCGSASRRLRRRNRPPVNRGQAASSVSR